MFTGLIEEIGMVQSIKAQARTAVLSIKAREVLAGTRAGDSISTNGVCLTVTALTEDSFTADVMPETMGRTNLGKLKAGSRVNLERAMAAGDRFGGHMVTGHIDGTGVVVSARDEENAVRIRIRPERSLLKYIIERGSVAVDGTSLTVAGLGEDWFEVSIIPHTRDHTALTFRHAGEEVNLECDIIGKYVERLLSFREPSPGKVDLAFLKENGFL